MLVENLKHNKSYLKKYTWKDGINDEPCKWDSSLLKITREMVIRCPFPELHLCFITSMRRTKHPALSWALIVLQALFS